MRVTFDSLGADVVMTIIGFMVGEGRWDAYWSDAINLFIANPRVLLVADGSAAFEVIRSRAWDYVLDLKEDDRVRWRVHVRNRCNNFRSGVTCKRCQVCAYYKNLRGGRALLQESIDRLIDG
jgi:hypothetical protein